jgi:hypothetical protein
VSAANDMAIAETATQTPVCEGIPFVAAIGVAGRGRRAGSVRVYVVTDIILYVTASRMGDKIRIGLHYVILRGAFRVVLIRTLMHNQMASAEIIEWGR